MEKYNRSMRWMHWLVGVMIITLVAVGFWMTYFIPEDASYKWDVYGLHKSFGVIVLGLVVIRVSNRVRSQIPPLPDAINKREQLLGKLGHLGLYAAMFVMPISGFVMSQAGGYGVKVFGWKAPELIAEDKALGGIAHEVHEYAGLAFAILIGVHILAVIKHKMMDKVSLIKRVSLP